MSIKGDTGRAMRMRRGSLKSASLAFAVTLTLSSTVGCAKIGEVTIDDRLVVASGDRHLVDANIGDMKEAWQAPFRW